jgi:predicted RND superfamily exporter protein
MTSEKSQTEASPSGAWSPWLSGAAPWAALALALSGALSVTLFVDVSPRVEGEFFFAEDDPQMLASETVRERFPAGSQLILRVADLEGDTAAYRARIADLTADLLTAPGVIGGYSIATNDPDSPLFGRVLLTRDPGATNIVLDVDTSDPEALLPPIEAIVASHEVDALGVIVSGVPAIVEMIRRSLDRDLAVFSLSAILVFALLIAAVYRDAAVVLGTLSTCFVSVSLTLLAVRAVGVPIGLLTANLVTIVFVLTLSHVVFLTANWSRALAGEPDRGEALAAGVRRTLEPSFWSMATTLLGFLSLLIATARPLRELGIAGAIGTVTALLSAFVVYPAFLGRWARPRPAEGSRARDASGARARWPVLGGAGLVVLVGAVGVARLDTDPTLLSYFDDGSEIRRGLDAIDADGGTSTLDVVVRDPGGRPVGTPAVFSSMEELQDALDDDPAVGVVLSPAVLVAHARTLPLAGFLPAGMLLDLAASQQLGGVGLAYVTPERDQARFSLRMREGPGEPRDRVIARVEGLVDDAGLESVVIAGLYDLQAQLGRLIESSLRIGIGGLLALFFGVAWVVSRSPGTATRMWACLVAIPAVILGTFGHLGIAVDIITSPAANIALAIGADSMIHLVVRVRTLAASGEARAWAGAVEQIRGPVLGATGIICAGFGIFVLSSFPPTRRFGLAVILGTAAAATMALVVLPRLSRLSAPPS